MRDRDRDRDQGAAMRHLLLGVDGGATKTVALIAEPDGTIVGFARNGSSDIHAGAAPPERVGYVATIDATDRIDAWLRGLLRLRNGPPPGPASLRSGASGSRLSWLSD